MEKVTITFKKKEKESKEISLPYYSKNNAFHYKVISNEELISVSYDNSITIHKALSCALGETETEITEEEFKEEFDRALNELKKLV